MLQKIKNFIIEPKQEKQILTNALEHYCHLCDRGFHHRSAKKSHMKHKHKT